MPVTIQRIRELLDYNPETGVFVWKIKPAMAVKAGSVAGSVNNKGYRTIHCGYKSYQAHRLAVLYMTGQEPILGMDHINGIKDDNRYCNLREVDNRTNKQNMRHARADSTTGLLGVKPHKGNFWARISVGGKRISLGLFKKAEDAHDAYLKAKRIYHEGCTI